MNLSVIDSLINNCDDIESLWTYTSFIVLKVSRDEIYAVVNEASISSESLEKFREIIRRKFILRDFS
jgi:hypothetical protein